MTHSQKLSGAVILASATVLVGSVVVVLFRARNQKELNSPDVAAEEGGIPQVVQPAGAHA